MANESQPTAAPTLGQIWGAFSGEDTGVQAPTKIPEIPGAGASQPTAPATPVTPPATPPAPAPGTPPQQPAQPQEPPKGETNPEPPKQGQEGTGEEEEGSEGKESDQEEEENDSPMAFWEDVNALRGRPLKVDLSQFEDPTSPEAYMAVERAVREEAMADYDAFIEQTDSRAYAYFLHRRNGGSDEEFFAQSSDQLPDYEEFKGNVDLQKKVLMSALRGRKVSENVINLAIEQAEKNGTLFVDADREYQARKEEDQATLNDLKRQQAEQEANFTKAVDIIETEMDEIIFKGKTKKLVIPETKRSEFATFLKGKLIHDDSSGHFILGQRINKDNLLDAVEALYFQFSGGDITKLVTAAARTQVARRLGANVKKAQASATGSQNKENNTPEFVPLTQLF